MMCTMSRPVIIILISALVMLGPFANNIMVPSLPALASSLTVSFADAQLILSVYMAGFAVGQLFVGPLSDRFGRRPVLVVALTIFLLASIGCAVAPDLITLCAVRLLQALGQLRHALVLVRGVEVHAEDGGRAERGQCAALGAGDQRTHARLRTHAAGSAERSVLAGYRAFAIKRFWTPFSRPFRDRFATVSDRFSGSWCRFLESWGQDGEDGEKTGKKRRKMGEKWPKESGSNDGLTANAEYAAR